MMKTVFRKVFRQDHGQRGAARRRGERSRQRFELLESRIALATDTWTGAADSNWSNGANWSLLQAPGPGDTAQFTAGATRLVANVDVASSVAGVDVDSSWGGAINVNNPLTVSSDFQLASGSFGGPGSVSVNKLGTWTGGTILAESGGFTIAKGATMTISGTANVVLDGGGTLTNLGTIVDASSGVLTINEGTTLYNGVYTAIFNFTANGSIASGVNGTNTFVNHGTIEKNGGTGTSTIGVTLNNTYWVQANLGTLDISGPVVQVSSGVLTTGLWQAQGAKPTTLTFSSEGEITTIAPGAAVVLAGAGADFTNIDGPGGLTTNQGKSFGLEVELGKSFATAGDYTTSGNMTLGPTTAFSVNGNFTQTATSTVIVQLTDFTTTQTTGEFVTSATGTVTLAGKLVLTPYGPDLPAIGSVFTILSNGNSSTPINGTFTGLPEGATFVSGGMRFKISYVGGAGNDVTLTRVEANQPNHLVVTTQPPANVDQNVAFDVHISDEDQNGNVDTSFTGPVKIALAGGPSGASLGGTLTVNAVNGVADFSDLTLNQPGTGYDLEATSGSLGSATTDHFNVNSSIGNQPAIVGDNQADQCVVTAQADGSIVYQVTSGGNVIQSGSFSAGSDVPLLDFGPTSTVTVNGTSGSGTFALAPNEVTIDGVTLDATSATNRIANWQLNGNGANDLFNLSGSVGDMSIQAGGGATTVHFSSGSSTSGSINGNGNATLDYSGYGAAVSVNLATGAATGVKAVSGINTVELGDGASNVTGTGTTTLVGPSETNTWNVTSSTGGTIVYVKNNVRTAIKYAGIANLVGGANSDTFALSSGVLPGGTIDGGAGTNTLSFFAYAATVAVSVDLHGAADTVTSGGTTVSFANIQSILGGASAGNQLTGPAAASTWNLTPTGAGSVGGISFSYFKHLVGWSNADTLVGANSANTFAVNAANAGSYNMSTFFTGMANVVGGTNTNLFQVWPAGSLSGTVAGGPGPGLNTLDYTHYFASTSGGGSVSVDLSNATATGLAGFSNIQVFKGSSHSDTLSDTAGTHTWTLTASGAGNVDGVYTFSSFENLAGSGGDTLQGANATVTWVISGTNAGTYNTATAFAGMASLVGGSGADAFNFNDAAALTGSLNGGGGTNALKYAAYTTQVTVNLDDGSATGVAAGADGMIQNIANATGGAGNNVLVGNSLANVLTGGKGQNVIIGGGGGDILTAGPGQDLLIAGTTSFDMLDADLALIAAEWFKTGPNETFAQRVANLSGAPTDGYAGPYLISDLASAGTPTVSDDGAVDTLNGNVGTAATDWFFANTSASNADVIKNNLARDVITAI